MLQVTPFDFQWFPATIGGIRATWRGKGILGPELIRVFNELLAVERVNLNEQFQRDLSSMAAKMSANGTLQSSMAVLQFAKIAANTIPIFSNVVLNLMARSLAAHGTNLDDSNYELVVGEIKRHIESEVAELQLAFKATPSFRNVGSRVPSATAQIDQIAARELQRVSAELRLMLAANKQKQGQGSSVTHVFNGPIGLVQTGAGSIGFSSQRLDSGAKEALERAMDSLVEALDQVTDHDARLTEVRELATDTKVEVAKPKPNLTKVKSLVSGIGSAISFTPKLKDAYDTLKWAAALIGMTLP